MGKNQSGGKYKFYAVRNGRSVGIFLKWVLACKSVDKYKSCNHQGFNDLEEAVSYLKCSGIKNIVVYTDEGSISLEKYKERKEVNTQVALVYTSSAIYIYITFIKLQRYVSQGRNVTVSRY